MEKTAKTEIRKQAIRRALARWISKRKATAGNSGTVKESVTEEETAAKKVADKEETVHKANPQAQRFVDMEVRLERFVASRYLLRYNMLTDITEMARHRDGVQEGIFRPLTPRDLNALCREAHREGICCWDRDLSRLVLSSDIPAYHPIRAYLDSLPAWDGRDRLADLSGRVSENPVWTSCFHRWMLALVAQWTGRDQLHANAVAPLLVSSSQGMGKSTFCRALMPPELRAYYSDSLDLSATGGMERKLTTFGLLNLDEFDRIGASRQPLLKNLMQLKELNYRKAFSRHAEALPRIASFIGTSNSHDLLTDTSGSRRFICVEVTRPIDSTHLDYPQIYAQLMAELDCGERYWFSPEEEEMLHRNNLDYYRMSPVEDVFRRHYRAALPEEPVRPLSLTDMMQHIRRKNPIALRGVNLQAFARAVLAAGVERRHTKEGNRYRVVEVKEEQYQKGY